MSIGCYYWGPPIFSNFGDLLSTRLLKHYAGLDAVWAPPTKADVVVSGSVLDSLPPGWTGTVAGAGCLLESSSIDLTRASVRAVRGYLTLGNITTNPAHPMPIVGDPALLASEMVAARQVYDLGVVPHWSDATLFPRFEHLNPIAIPTTGDPLEVIRLIGSCKKIVTSSLHGMIVADAFGIPRRVEKFPAMHASPKEGGDFKFRDYSSSLGMPMEWSVHGGQVAPRERVEELQVNLFEMLSGLANG